MVIRHGMYLALRWAPIVLPLWYMLIAGFRGWDQIGVLAVPVFGIALAASLAIVFFLTWIRKDVRLDEAVSWVDVGVLGVWFGVIIAWPFPIDIPMTLLVLIAGLVAFWSAIIQWAFETRRRVRAVIDELGATVQSAQAYRTTNLTRPGGATPDAPLRGQVIRIEPPEERRDD